MSPARKTAVPLFVDIGGVEVTASLRPPRSACDNFRVRWRLNGVTYEKSTGVKTSGSPLRAQSAERFEASLRPHRGHAVIAFSLGLDAKGRLSTHPIAERFGHLKRSSATACGVLCPPMVEPWRRTSRRQRSAL